MSPFTITVLQALTIAISLSIGYVINKSSLKIWRALAGFIVGFSIGWSSGVIVWALIFMPGDSHNAIVLGMPKSFLFALAGAAGGVFWGRKKAKSVAK